MLRVLEKHVLYHSADGNSLIELLGMFMRHCADGDRHQHAAAC